MELDATLIKKITDYQPSAERLAEVRDVPLLFIVGISGAGKNTIMNRMLHTYADSYHEFITHTTRLPRKNHGVMEKDGVEYHFVDFATANSMFDAHEYIEANIYSGNIYGTSLAEMEAAKKEGKIVIGDIDVNGVANFVKYGLNVKPVFVLPPNYKVWQERLLKRYEGHEIDAVDWQRRMQTAKTELEQVLAAPYYYLVINDDLIATTERINAIAHGEDIEQRPEDAVAIMTDMIESIEQALLRE